MAGTVLSYPLNGAANWEAFPDIVQKMQAGFNHVALSHIDDEDEPQILAGSTVDVNGVVAVFAADESITGWSGLSVGAAWIKVVVSGASATVAFTQTAPTYSAAKRGYYDGNDRYIGGLYKGGASAYVDKYLYEDGRERVAPVEHWLTKESGATIAAGDLVMRTVDDTIQKYFRKSAADTAFTEFTTWGGGNRINNKRFVFAGTNTTTWVRLVACSITPRGVFSWGSSVTVETFASAGAYEIDVVMLTDTTGIITFHRNVDHYTRGYAYTIDSSNVITLGAGITITTTDLSGLWLLKLDSTRALLLGFGTNLFVGATLSVSGTTLSASSVTTLAAITSGCFAALIDDSSTAVVLVGLAKNTLDQIGALRVSIAGTAAPTATPAAAWITMVNNFGNYDVAGYLSTERAAHSQAVLSFYVPSASADAYGWGWKRFQVSGDSSAVKIDQVNVRWLGPLKDIAVAIEPFMYNRIESGEGSVLNRKLLRDIGYLFPAGDDDANAGHFYVISAVFAQQDIHFDDPAGWDGYQSSGAGSIFPPLSDRTFIKIYTSPAPDEVYLYNSPAAVIGVALNAHGKYAVNGEIAPASGLTPGKVYYVGDDGLPTSGRRIMRIGQAISATELLVDIGVEIT